MAKRRSNSSVQIVRAVPVRSPAPIIRVMSPRAPAAPKKKHHRRRSSSANARSGGLSMSHMAATAFGGFGLGFIDKNFPTLPTLPVIGRAGSIALFAYALGKWGGVSMGGIVRDVALAGAAVAGYEMGKDGKVVGEVMGVPPQVSGIASNI